MVIKIRQNMCQEYFPWAVCGLCHQPLSPHRLIMFVLVKETKGVQSKPFIGRRLRKAM